MNIHFLLTIEFEKLKPKKEIYFYKSKVEDNVS